MAINLILILREAIQAKTSWRSSTLLQIIKVNATEGVGKLLVRIQKMQIMQHQPLADHILVCIFWILSALATKGKTECHRLSILPKHKLYKLLFWILESYCCIAERHFNHFFEMLYFFTFVWKWSIKLEKKWNMCFKKIVYGNLSPVPDHFR